jgi:RHS repeat-associated protein
VNPCFSVSGLLGYCLRLLLCVSAIGVAQAGELVTFYHHDVVGSPVLATDAAGSVMWLATYEPYGERIQSSTDQVASLSNERWYTSHVQDVETGLVYMQARFYDPVIGRFMAMDPVAPVPANPLTFNRYAYALNNPYKYDDPDGEFANFIIGGVKAAVENAVIQQVEIRLGLRQEFSWGELASDAAIGTVTSGLSTLKNTGRLAQIAAKVTTREQRVVAAAEDAQSSAARALKVDVDAMARAAAAPDRGGLTRAGRALDKHGAGKRSDASPFPPPRGSVRDKNALGEYQVEDLLTDPDAVFQELGRGGIEVRVPDGRAMRYDADGRFAGFIE